MFRVRPGYKATPPCNIFMFSVAFKLFDMKMTSQVRPGLKIQFMRSFFKSFQILFQKTKPKTFIFEHVKGYPDSFTYGKIKGNITLNANRETPCESDSSQDSPVSNLDLEG